MQPVRGDPVERGVVEDYDAVRALGQPLEGQHGVVGLDDDVGDADVVGGVLRGLLVGEDAVGLDQLLWVPGKIERER